MGILIIWLCFGFQLAGVLPPGGELSRFQGARGKPPYDLAALAQTLAAFSRLPFIYPQISEVDLNPVFLRNDGLVVGDVRVIAWQG
ncbi:MAG TPA: hypothetical protein DCP32_04950 [Anaerolineaceae bacterium]|nr:hypothetical protein [Anaerolineaceae bacterium]